MDTVQSCPITLPANPAGGDIARGLRVKLASGVIAVAGITDNDFVGWLPQRYVSSGVGKTKTAAVVPRNVVGTVMMVANGAISLHAVVHTAASGKVSATAAATSLPHGIALQAATADGDLIEVMPFNGYPAENA